MISTQMKQAESDAFLDATQAGFSAFASSGGVGDDEIDKMIDGEMGLERGLDAEIAELERKLAGDKVGNEG